MESSFRVLFVRSPPLVLIFIHAIVYEYHIKFKHQSDLASSLPAQPSSPPNSRLTRRRQLPPVNPEVAIHPAYRALFLSDLHLGTRACQADRLQAFLRGHHAERVYLVGDVLDLWRFRSAGLHVPQTHVNVVRTLLGMTKHGTEIIYIPGNHDELLRQFLDAGAPPRLGRIRVQAQAVHETLDGRRLLVVHGDQHDRYLKLLGNRPLHWIIDKLYGLLTMASLLTRPLFPQDRTLSQAVRSRLKRVNTFYQRFAEDMRQQARQAGFDGVVCGHIHHPALAQSADSLYINCGDWVDHCTAVAETLDGRFVFLQQPPLAKPGVPVPELRAAEVPA